MSPRFSVPRLNQNGRHRTPALVELGFDDHAVGVAIGVGFQFEDLGERRDRLREFVEAGLLQRRNLHGRRLAAHRFDLHVVLQELGQNLVRIGVVLVDLVDRHDDRRAGRFRVLDRLDRLRHHAVVRRHHEDDDVGGVGAAGAHGREGRVARRVEEGDLLAGLQLDLIGADVLRDAARLARHDVGLAQGVEQRRLAVVDVTHDGHDRRTRFKVIVVVVMAFKADLDVGFRNAFHGVAEFLDDELGGIRVQHVGRADEFALLHHELHDVGLPLAHAVGEVGDGDDFRQDDFARDFLGSAARHLETAFALAFAGALHGGVGTLLVLIVAEGGRDRQPALAAFGFVLARGTDFAARSIVIAGGLDAFDASAEFATAASVHPDRAGQADADHRRDHGRVHPDRGRAPPGPPPDAAGHDRRETAWARTTGAGTAGPTRATRTTRTSPSGRTRTAPPGRARSASTIAAEACRARARRSAARDHGGSRRAPPADGHGRDHVRLRPLLPEPAAGRRHAQSLRARRFSSSASRRASSARRRLASSIASCSMLAALLVGAGGVDRGLARLEFGFREVGLLHRLLRGRRLRRGRRSRRQLSRASVRA